MINIKICTRWPYNFKKYLNKKYYQTNHPDGVLILV
jgi:hypothetical protein